MVCVRAMFTWDPSATEFPGIQRALIAAYRTTLQQKFFTLLMLPDLQKSITCVQQSPFFEFLYFFCE